MSNDAYVQRGDAWFIRIKGAQILSEVFIEDVTLHTVNLEENDMWRKSIGRYAKVDLEFIERIDPEDD